MAEGRRTKRWCGAGLIAGLVMALAVTGAAAAQRVDTTEVVSLDAAGHFEGLRPAGGVLTLVVANRQGVTASAEAVALNVTVTDARAPGFVTVYPCGQPVPTASNVNYVVGSTVPNAVVVKIGDGGAVCLFTYAVTHLIVDLNGYFLNGANYTPLAPTRLVDTRAGSPTFDGNFSGIGKIAAGTSLALPVIGRAGVPVDTKSLVLNVTAVNPEASGFLTVYPCGTQVPTASNVNFVKDQVVPNTVFAKISDGGSVCIFAYATTDVVVDLNGYFPNIAAYTPLNPTRLVDTRPGSPTFDGNLSGVGKVQAGTSLTLPIVNRGGVPANEKAVVLNVTVTDPEAPGFLTVYPCGGPVPTASNVNFVTDQVVPNTVIAKTNAAGQVCIFAYATTNVVVDLEGYFPVDAAYQPLNPTRISDSRS